MSGDSGRNRVFVEERERPRGEPARPPGEVEEESGEVEGDDAEGHGGLVAGEFGFEVEPNSEPGDPRVEPERDAGQRGGELPGIVASPQVGQFVEQAGATRGFGPMVPVVGDQDYRRTAPERDRRTSTRPRTNRSAEPWKNRPRKSSSRLLVASRSVRVGR